MTEANYKTKKHPADQVGEKRICPHTGEEFQYCWSEKEIYDACDSCREGLHIVKRLHNLNDERRKNND